METKDLSIIIPAYKEAARLGKTLDQLRSYLKQHNLGQVEVIVVVTKSSDQTAEVARQQVASFANLKVLESNVHRGKGHAVAEGMQQAVGRYRLFMDADLATPLHHLENVKRHIEANADIIIGVRDLAKIHKGLPRKLISTFGNILVRVVLGLKIKDTQCGFKAFRDRAADDLFTVQKIEGWGFDMELLTVAKARGYSLATIDIEDWQDVAGGTLGVGIKASLTTFIELFKIKWYLITGKYEQKQGGEAQT